MASDSLDSEQVSSSYDEQRQILCVTFRGAVTPEITSQVYKWFRQWIETYGLREVRGTILDFRKVTNFVVGNLNATETNSQRLNQDYDLRNHPVALLVYDIYQQAMVKAALNMTPQQERKRIVHTPEGAWAFITEWHEQQLQENSNPWA
jgi:hypothetical protein